MNKLEKELSDLRIQFNKEKSSWIDTINNFTSRNTELRAKVERLERERDEARALRDGAEPDACEAYHCDAVPDDECRRYVRAVCEGVRG